MKRMAFLAGILALAAPLALAQTSTWVPDKMHSEVDFTILHMSLSNVHGRFGNLGGQIVQNDSDITKSTVNITIDVGSVDTGVGPRDADLKSDHFFDVSPFPHGDICQYRYGKERQWPDREWQPDIARRHEARGA